MSDYLKIILPASIALIGTIITILIGYRQWKRQQEASRYATFITEKQAAYKGLWEKLEEVHIKLRTEDVSHPDFNTLVLGVNAYILKNSLYLEEHDRVLSNQYLQAVRKLKESVIISKNERAKVALETSVEIPEEVIKAAEEIRINVNEVNLIRNSIIERFRKVVGGSMIH